MLLADGSRQHMLIGDASMVFWSKEKSYFESCSSSFFSEPNKDDPDASTQEVRRLFDSIKTGAYLGDDPNAPFYILGLSPNASRLSVRFWEPGTIGTLADRIREYFEDFAIIKPQEEPEYYSLWRILVNVSVLDESKNIPPNLAGELMRSILCGSPYPATLLQAVMRRIHSDAGNRVKPVRAAVIKAYLNRYNRSYSSLGQKEIAMELDVSQPSIGYQLGRLFATLEKIQSEAAPGINATISERYYGAACGTPVTVFPTLLRLKNHHIAKLENRGRVVFFDKLLEEIIGKFADFPTNLDLHEQGRFAIGYYHQKQAFFTRKDGAGNEVEHIASNNDEAN
jgi:CRISPR-associated protein Csd1